MHGRSLELFFINNRPDSMLTAEMFGWTGHILLAPRLEIKDALKRAEAGYTGVYLLVGEMDTGSKVYVGEGEIISHRIKSHDTQKDWWTKAILITTSANNLNKAHVKYLESRLVEEALNTGNAEVDNGNAPTRPSLSEAARANMEAFLDNVLMVLPAIGIDAFLQKKRPSRVAPTNNEVSENGPRFTVKSKQLGVGGEAILENREFVVQAGTIARGHWRGDRKHGYMSLFLKLIENGVLRAENGKHVFSENYAFQSPSAASAVIFGTPRNGQVDWKHTETGLTYRDWEQQEIDKLI